MAGLLLAGLSIAQSIELRLCTPLTVAMNILGAGVVYSDGDIDIDPVLEIEDATVEQKMAGVLYQPAFGLLDRSARSA